MNTKESLIERQKAIVLELDAINDTIDEKFNSWSNEVTTPARKFLETFQSADYTKSFTEKLTAYNKEITKSGGKYVKQVQLYDSSHEIVFSWYNNSRNKKISGYRRNALALIEEFDFNVAVVYDVLPFADGSEKPPTEEEEPPADFNTYVPWAVGLVVAFILYKRFRK